METATLTQVMLPLAIVIIMLGLGLSLSGADFRRVATFPKPMLLGLFLQLIVTPLVAFALVRAFGLSAELAVGVMVIAAVPSGATSTVYSHLTHADVALNVTMTAINNLVAVVTMPIVINLSLTAFAGDAKPVQLETGKVLVVALIMVLPVVVGMVVRARAAVFAKKLERPVRLISALLLIVIIVAAVLKERVMLLAALGQVGAVVVVLGALNIALGFGVLRLAGSSVRQSVAMGMAMGVHNGTLAIAIASSPSMLGSTAMALPGAVYSLTAYGLCALFGGVMAKRCKAESA